MSLPSQVRGASLLKGHLSLASPTISHAAPPLQTLVGGHLARARGMPPAVSAGGPERAAATAALTRPDCPCPLCLPSLGLTLLTFYYSFAIVGMEFFNGRLYHNCCKYVAWVGLGWPGACAAARDSRLLGRARRARVTVWEPESSPSLAELRAHLTRPPPPPQNQSNPHPKYTVQERLGPRKRLNG